MTDVDIEAGQFVAAFGKDAALGCFDAGVELHRGDRVLLQTPRGQEVGSVLCPASLRQARLLGAQVRGRVLRRLGVEDEQVLARSENVAQAVLDGAHALADELGLPLVILDVDVLFDGGAVLQILHAQPDELASFVQTLGQRCGVEVRLANLAQPLPEDEPAAAGCGKPDCGKTDGGGCDSCSSGGCSSCGTPGTDLRPYFAHLRAEMEAKGRVPLN